MHFLIALLVGAASAFAFEPTGLWPLMPIALAILCEEISRAPSLRRALLIGWGFGVGQFCVGLNWIATAFTFQAAMPAWLGWVAVLLLSLYLAVYPMLAAGLAWRFGKERRLALVLALAGSWAITEWLRATMFTGFAWNPVGVSLADTPWLSASQWTGTYSLSALVVLAGGLMWLAFRREARPAMGIGAALLAFALVPFAPLPPATNPRAIRIIQPNIGQGDKWRPGFAEEAERRLMALSIKPGGERPRLLFWPEAAVTEPLDDARGGGGDALATTERVKASAPVGEFEYLFTGGLGLESRDQRTVSGATNSVFVIGSGGS
ncbi:apolipoprotein N-acyltransferase, partial [Sphingomonas sp.]|uniref:apolipoprotein N-acyltransferase n=1 Tax=Sphingomonas sp. TaxID=28214 RepID=UPI00345C2285